MGAVPESMFNVGFVPWHGLGIVLDEAPVKGQAIMDAGLNWRARKDDLFCIDGSRVPDHYAVRRDSDKHVLGVVGDKYEVIQNADLFELAEACLEQGAKFQSAGQLFGGRVTWIVARTDGCVDAVTGDTVEPFLLLSNSFDGSAHLQGCLTPIQTVCENTLAAAIAAGQRQIKIRHTSGWFNKAAEAKRVLGCARDVFGQLQITLGELAEVKLDWSKLPTFVDRMIPLPKDIKGARLDKVLDDRLLLTSSIEKPLAAQYSADTLYTAVSGVTEYATRRWPEKRIVGSNRERAERRMADLALGGGPRTRFVERALSNIDMLAV